MRGRSEKLTLQQCHNVLWIYVEGEVQMPLILSKSLLGMRRLLGWPEETADTEEKLMLALILHFGWRVLGHTLQSSDLHATEEIGRAQMESEDVGAPVPAALFLCLPVTALVDV